MGKTSSAAFFEPLESRRLFSVVFSWGGSGVLFTAPPVGHTTQPDAIPTILTPSDGSEFSGGQIVTFRGTALHRDGSRFPNDALNWRVELLDHGLTTNVPFSRTADGGSFVIPTDGSLSASASYRIRLSVTGTDGEAVEVNRDVRPRLVHVQFAGNWPAASLWVDGVGVTDAGFLSLVTNSTHEIRFQSAGAEVGVLHKFKGARKIGVATLRRTANEPLEAVYTLTTKATDLKVISRYANKHLHPNSRR
jgi:hypothetical protein